MSTSVDGRKRTFEERLETRNNALNFVRLSLACIVIVHHAVPLGGFLVPLKLGNFSVGHMAVGGFFCISGYLITRSRLGSNSIGRFAWKRALRILPAFWVCLVVTAAVIALIGSQVTGGWALSAAISYVVSNADMWNGDHTIGTTISALPFPLDWNGSLWTLRFEILCYAMVAIAMSVGFVRRNPRFVLGAFVIATAVGLLGSDAWPQPVKDLVFLVPFFLAGAVLFVYSDRVRVSWRLAALAGVSLGVVSVLNLGHELGGLPTAYLCMWLGVSLPQGFKRIGARNDFSYGMYLYGMPVQQLLVIFGAAGLGQLGYTLLSIVATIPLAIASWFLVEKPALRLTKMKRPTLTGRPREHGNATVAAVDGQVANPRQAR